MDFAEVQIGSESLEQVHQYAPTSLARINEMLAELELKTDEEGPKMPGLLIPDTQTDQPYTYGFHAATQAAHFFIVAAQFPH